jgi:hypothetical protein
MLFGIELTTADRPGMQVDFDGDCVDRAALSFAASCATADFPTVEGEWVFWLSVATPATFVALAVPRVLYLSSRKTKRLCESVV